MSSSVYLPTKPRIEFVKMSPEAVLPAPGRIGDIGFDLTSICDLKIPAGGSAKVSTGIRLANVTTPTQAWKILLKIEGRSGLASKGIFPVGGIIDPTRVVKIALQNAASVAGTILLTETVIVEEKKTENNDNMLQNLM